MYISTEPDFADSLERKMAATDINAMKVIVTIAERDFQKHSVENKIYCVPVDQVRQGP